MRSRLQEPPRTNLVQLRLISLKMVVINNPCIHNEVKYNPRLSMLYIVAGVVDRDGLSYPARWHGSYQYWKSHRYFVTIFRVWSFYQGWSANQMEALRRSPQAVWNHYHHLYHSRETFQFWNLHLVPLKCSFENLNSDQSRKYFYFNLTDLYQCKLVLLQNKIWIKSFFCLSGFTGFYCRSLNLFKNIGQFI